MKNSCEKVSHDSQHKRIAQSGLEGIQNSTGNFVGEDEGIATSKMAEWACTGTSDSLREAFFTASL